MSQETVVDTIIVEPTTKPVETKDETPAAAKPPAKPVNPLDALTLPDDESIDPTYRGKTAAQLIEMHRNANSKIGEQGREIGVWRGLVNDLSQARPQADAAPVIAEKPTPVTPEALLTDPEGVIARVVESAITKATKPLADNQARDAFAREEAALRADFPDVNTTLADDGFKKWATGSRTRLADLQAAAKGDLTAGRRLLENWADRQSLVPATKPDETPTATDAANEKPQGLQGARDSVTESGGAGAAPVSGTIIYQSDVVKLINTNPAKYNSDEYQRELRTAIKEGRLRA
jgi:hypothetical protein